MEKTVNLGIVGCGRWGINHVRTAYQLLQDELRYVCDANDSAKQRVQQISESINFTKDLQVILRDETINGVVIASSAETHFSIAKQCLEYGKHVLVEKPITLNVTDAKILIDVAKANNRQIMVGHVLLYHPAIVTMNELYQAGKIGTLQYIYSNRLNLGAIRSEENILWSFAPHDISIIQNLVKSKPISIETHGAHFIQNGIEDTTITYLKYANNVHAHVFVSWLHPFKEQRLVVIGNKGMFVFEDSAVQDKLKFYPKGFQSTPGGIQKFEGEFETIPFNNTQPLVEEHKHFYHCIRTNTPPLTNGEHALEVLEILEQATRKLKYD